MPTAICFFDIGNTNIKMGVSLDGAPPVPFSLPTDARATADSFGLSLLQLIRHLGLEPRDLAGGLAASVSPGMNPIVRQACKRFLGFDLVFAPEDVPVPLENRYALPHEVGADRLVGAFAARRRFPGAPSIISVDYGTATTFDCVEGDAYLGGLICPGVQSSLAALASGTAKLSRVSLEVEGDTPAPGRSTATSIGHGFVFGFAAMTEGLVDKLKRGMKGPTTVIGAGGLASLVAGAAPGLFDAVAPDLVVEGLQLLYNGRGNG